MIFSFVLLEIVCMVLVMDCLNGFVDGVGLFFGNELLFGFGVMEILVYYDVDGGFWQVFVKVVLIEFGYQGLFYVVVFVEECQLEGKVDVIEDFSVFCLGDYCLWVYYCGQVVIDECILCYVCKVYYF